MKSHAHRLAGPTFASTSSGIDVSGRTDDGRQVRLHLITAKGLDPESETNRLTAGAMTTNEAVVSARVSQGGMIDGAVIDAARSGRFASYADPSEAMFAKKGIIGGLLSKVTGRDDEERRTWRSMQSEVLHSLRAEGSDGVDSRSFIRASPSTNRHANESPICDRPLSRGVETSTDMTVNPTRQASMAAMAARHQGLGG